MEILGVQRGTGKGANVQEALRLGPSWEQPPYIIIMLPFLDNTILVYLPGEAEFQSPARGLLTCSDLGILSCQQAS